MFFFEFHHYHSTAHEVLVVYSGSAKVQLGGERPQADGHIAGLSLPHMDPAYGANGPLKAYWEFSD